MKVSHILYKVENLKKGVENFREQGFTVEYGTSKKPYNALIYFSEGPYLELIGEIKFPKLLEFIMKILGKGKVVERINSWHYSEEGLIGVCLDTFKADLESQKNILRKYNHKYYERNSKRLDVKNRLLKFKVLFPDELKIPFLMTYFNIDPKPKNYIHPNGIKKIKSISFGTDQKYISLINELCNDKTLKLFIGKGVSNLVYEIKG